MSDRVFFNNHLKADLASDANDNSGSYTTASTTGGIFSARSGATFDDGSRGIYWVKSPDVLTSFGTGTSAALNYAGNPNGAAAIQYDGSTGGGKVVYFGFPFETITSATLRQQYMADILTFFTAGAATLVGAGSVWNYDDTGANLGTAWREVNFNDGAWSSGPAQLGFGDDDEATVVNTNRTRITTYFRRTFSLATTGELATVTLRVKRDDGVVVHLNGVEVFRNNLPAGPIAWATQAVIASGGADESAWFTTNVSAGLLIAGTNVVAAEVHQNGTNSTDLSFDLELLATLRPPMPVTLIANGATWRYLDNGVNLGVSWRSNSFSDSAWKSGVGKLGFGGDGEVTLLNRTNANGTTNITFYFRNQFYVPNPLAVQILMARMIRDDGAVVYLNGTEVWRDSMPAGAISFSTLASTAIGGADEMMWLTNTFSPSALIAGWNVLAAEAHQATNTSSDAGFNFELLASVSVPPPPRLDISVSALSWTAEGAFASVYSANSLSPPVAWAVVTNSPALLNGQWTILLPLPTGDSRFFRLQAP